MHKKRDQRDIGKYLKGGLGLEFGPLTTYGLQRDEANCCVGDAGDEK